VYKSIKSTTIENGIKRALSTGDFGINKINVRVGVAQVLNRMTYASILSHLRRINTPVEKSGKMVPPRKLAPSSWGFLCPVETPEGPTVGVVKNLSVMTHITIISDSSSLYDIILPQIESLDKVNRMRVNYVLNDNSKKYYDIKLPENIRIGDIITISINNINGTYIIK
jgi:DNA-directed RNA polymerase II subunit RPB2